MQHLKSNQVAALRLKEKIFHKLVQHVRDKGIGPEVNHLAREVGASRQNVLTKMAELRHQGVIGLGEGGQRYTPASLRILKPDADLAPTLPREPTPRKHVQTPQEAAAWARRADEQQMKLDAFLSTVENYIKKHGHGPTGSQLMGLTGLNQTRVSKYMNTLREANRVAFTSGNYRTLKILSESKQIEVHQDHVQRVAVPRLQPGATDVSAASDPTMAKLLRIRAEAESTISFIDEVLES